MGKILIVDDEGKMRAMLAMALDAHGHNIFEADSGESAQKKVDAEPFDIVITDLRMPGISGLELCKRIKQKQSQTEVILMTAFADGKSGIEAMRSGAIKYICKPFEIEEMLAAVNQALEKKKLSREVSQTQGASDAPCIFDFLLGRSRAMQETIKRAKIVAHHDTTVLIRGKSGTGKELVAHGIHQESGRKTFFPVNCGAIAENLLESELFGYEKGAFTGANERKIGYFERADHGTIFLDEIGDISLALQIKLLRVLQEKEFTRVGGTRIIPTRARVIAATNRNLEEAVSKGAFREDLYFRLNVFPVIVPSLGERREDIGDLIDYFLKKYKHTTGIDERVREYCNGYDWPGNVRELENCIECAVIVAAGNRITPDHLPETVRQSRSVSLDSGATAADDEFSLNEIERKAVIKALKKTKGNKSLASRLLGITRRALYSKMKNHHIGDADMTE